MASLFQTYYSENGFVSSGGSFEWWFLLIFSFEIGTYQKGFFWLSNMIGGDSPAKRGGANNNENSLFMTTGKPDKMVGSKGYKRELLSAQPLPLSAQPALLTFFKKN